MKVIYPDFSEILGYNYKKKESLYLSEPLFFRIVDGDYDKSFEISKGFSSDGCTILRIFWFILGCPHTREFIPGAIIHDYFTKNRELIKRNRASKALLVALLNEGTPKWKAYIMYFFVELYQKYWRSWD